MLCGQKITYIDGVIIVKKFQHKQIFDRNYYEKDGRC